MPNEIDDKTIASRGNDTPTVLKAEPVVSGLRVGMTLKNRFVLVKILGQGGMGTIFKARDLRKEEMEDRKPFVAIKVLHPKLQRNESLIKALQREARKSQELAHPNIVNVHDFDRDGQFVFMVMEYLQGKPLNVLLEDGELETIPLPERWSMIEKIGRGIAYAHEKKVIHYDIKPGNVFICDDGAVKVLDFGIAKARRSSSAENLNADENMTVFDQFSPDALTPAYAACEMLRWEPPDIRDDIYAFGCVAYEILTGKHPFNKMPATKAQLAGLSPAPIKGLSKPQWNAVKRMLAFDRADRMPDIGDFLLVGSGASTNEGLHFVYQLLAGTVFFAVLALATWQIKIFFVEGPPTSLGSGKQEPPPVTDRIPERRGPPPPPELQQKIDRILKIAESHLSVGRVFEPSGSSAADAYLTILDLDPESPEARYGLAKAQDICEQKARTTWQDGDLREARELVEYCLSLK
ncbi:MAG: serine/threonine-protein kinase, partial [Gammaproteobacteria bacterium]